jgi:hypothetical protein
MTAALDADSPPRRRRYSTLAGVDLSRPRGLGNRRENRIDPIMIFRYSWNPTDLGIAWIRRFMESDRHCGFKRLGSRGGGGGGGESMNKGISGRL